MTDTQGPPTAEDWARGMDTLVEHVRRQGFAFMRVRNQMFVVRPIGPDDKHDLDKSLSVETLFLPARCATCGHGEGWHPASGPCVVQLCGCQSMSA